MLEDKMPPRGDKDGYVRAHNELLGHNSWISIGLARINMQYRDGILLSKVHVECDNNAYIATGTIGTLRWTFVEIE